MNYVTLAELARRWRVDQATARAALLEAHISPSLLHASPRYSWTEVLREIERLPDEVHADVDIADVLQLTAEMADCLNVTAQSVRNYAQSGILQAVRLGPRTIRYLPETLQQARGEANPAELHQR